MKCIENECVDCGLPCMSSCKYKNVVRFYCDRCKEEEKLYHYKNEEICAECLLNEFEIVEGTDEW